MLFKKTRDIIVETATLVRGVKESQAGLQQDFKDHVAEEDKRDSKLYKVIKECHENCPESERFDKYITDANGTLKRIETKYDDYHDEIKGMKQARKTFRQTMADMGKIAACIGVCAGVVFGIIRYTEAKKTTEGVKIEKLLNEIIKEQRVEKERREEGI